MITREFNLYLHAGHSIPLVINVNQYDHGEQWLFKLFNSDGTQYVPSSGAIVGIKSDNLGIINTGSVDAQGRVAINETQQMTAAVGKAVFELVIDDGTHGTANFVVLVEPKPGDNADLSETDISMIEQAIEAASTIKPYGSPLVASTVAGMTDHEKVYVYVGSETGYTSGNWYYWNGSAWTSGGVYNSVAVQTDTTLTLSGVAADSKKVGDELSDLKSQITNGIPYAVKLALNHILQNVAFKNDTDYSADKATINSWATNINVTSITAVYTQSGTIYPSDSLDYLKADLVVTAYYDNGTSATINGYTLSGTLTVGENTITVAYGGKTATFTVTVSEGYALRTPFVSNGSNYVDTGLILEQNKAYTFAIDFTINTMPSEIKTIFGDKAGVTSGGYDALCIRNSGTSSPNVLWGVGLSFDNGKNKGYAGHRYRIVITFDTTTYDRTITFTDVTASTDYTFSRTTSSADINGRRQYIGSQNQTSAINDGFDGTVHSFILDTNIWNSDKITAFLNGE